MVYFYSLQSNPLKYFINSLKCFSGSTCRQLALGLCVLMIASAASADSVPSVESIKTPRVASINLCTDQLALLLAEPEQIVSLSNLSHDSAGSYLFEQARDFPINKGESEAVLALQPDIILAGQYTTKPTVKMLGELGFEVQIVPIANTLDQLYDNILNVSQWLGHPAKGKSMVADLKSRIDVLEKELNNHVDDNPTAAYYDPNGYTVGDKTLRGTALKLAGWNNVAAKWGIDYYGTMPLESLVSLAPDAIIESPYSVGTYSRAQQVLKHPALRTQGVDPMIITIPSRQTICAGPWTVDMVELLARKRAEILTSPN